MYHGIVVYAGDEPRVRPSRTPLGFGDNKHLKVALYSQLGTYLNATRQSNSNLEASDRG